MKQAYAICAALVMALPWSAWADAITVGGERLTGVVVREAGPLYIIQTPADGKAFTVRRADTEPGSVTISPEAERDALRAQWRAANERRAAEPSDDPPPSRQDEAATQPTPERERVASLPQVERADQEQGAETSASGARVDGILPRIDLKDIDLRTALRALLRAEGLDYRVVDDAYIFISTPERLRTEAFEPLETRVYDLNALGQTLPKAVVLNPGGFPQGGGLR